jgi:hypothetical protein
MKKIALIVLQLALAIASAAQIQVLPSVTNTQKQTLFQSIDSVSVPEMQPASTKDPFLYVGRTNEPVVLHATSFSSGSERSYGVVYSWTVTDSEDGSIDATPLGDEIDLSTLPEGWYDITVNAVGLNAIKPRNYIRGLRIEPPKFIEGDANLVIDLAQVQAGTYSIPGGLSITYDGGTNASFDFQEVVRPGFKIALKNNFVGVNIDWIGLIGTEASPVRIQNVGGQVTLTETSTQQLLLFGERCQYVTIDGKGTSDRYGIKLNGRSTAGDQSQLMYFIGSYIKGIRIFNVHFDQTRGVNTLGGACLQFAGTNADASVSADCNGTIGDPGYFTPAYFDGFNLKIENARDEGIYLGHFEDAAITGIYRAYSVGDIFIGYNSVINTGRDFIQFTSTTGAIVICNYGRNNALEANSSHNSAISFNDGNRGIAYVARNYFEDVEMFSSLQNGFTGNGNYHFYANYCRQRSTVTTNPNQFFFINYEDQIACHVEIFNNTFICADVNNNPFGVQFDAPSTFPDATLKIAYNAISTGGSNDSPYDEIRDVGTLPSDRSGWTISNTFRRTASESQLILTQTYRPGTSGSPVFNAGASLASFNLYGGNYDIDGYSNNVNLGYTAGCFSGHKLFLP